MYTYNINISKADGMNWNNTDYLYRYLFNAVFDNENAMKKALNEFIEKFPTPDYKIEVSRRSNCWEIL